jgi:hypothetical protein
MKTITYSRADKYVLADDYHDIAPFKPSSPILTTYGAFYINGQYTIFKGFLFSANFPAINTENSRRAACVHDFFYCLIKDECISRDFREPVDKLFYEHLIEDGMASFRAWYWYKAVRVGGDNALDSPVPSKLYAPPELKKKLIAGHQLKDTLKIG